ncbi:MAG TPA: hypothetical protein VJX94_32300, partial [Stellaceae bacterium]|nr:hypothetical protein [Stellaceae bacterium]
MVGGGAAEGRATHSLILAWREAHAKLGRYLELGERLSIGFHCYIAESREQGIREAAKFYEEKRIKSFRVARRCESSVGLTWIGARRRGMEFSGGLRGGEMAGRAGMR